LLVIQIRHVDLGSLFRFLHHCRIGDISTFVNISHNQRPICTILGEINAVNLLRPQHFWTDTTDIWIWVNPKIWIPIPDHFRLKFWHRRRFALSECSWLLIYLLSKYCTRCIIFFYLSVCHISRA